MALAAVAPHDRAQRGVGLHRRNRRCRSRSPFLRPRSATSASTQPNTVSWASCGRRERVRDSQEWSGTFSRFDSRRKSPRSENRSRATPRDAALAVDPLEVADHVHAEIPPRRERRRAHPRRVIRLAHPFNGSIEPGTKQVLPAIVERVSRRARHRRPRRQRIAPEPRPIAPSPSLIPAMPRRQHGISGTRLRQRAVRLGTQLGPGDDDSGESEAGEIVFERVGRIELRCVAVMLELTEQAFDDVSIRL